ncbi:MAG: hypothetical protein AB1540_06080 [Bdellovibrionota bacterium]
MANPSSENRKVLLINPRFQLSFIGYMVAMALLMIAIFYAANIYFFWEFVKKGKDLGLPPDHVFFQFLAEQRGTMNMIFLVTAIFAFTFLVAYGIYLSHRVAGPLYRLQKFLQDMASSNSVQECQFREKDYFHEVADAVNAFVKKHVKS